MSVHNVEVHRCRDCNEVVVIVPEGFTLSDEELKVKADTHRETCPVLVERTQENG